MNQAIFGIGVIIWMVAAFAVIRIVMAWISVANAAPAGRKVDAALALGRWNHPEVARIAGEAVAPAILRYRSAVKLFLICLIPFLGLVLLNALSGNAA